MKTKPFFKASQEPEFQQCDGGKPTSVVTLLYSAQTGSSPLTTTASLVSGCDKMTLG